MTKYVFHDKVHHTNFGIKLFTQKDERKHIMTFQTGKLFIGERIFPSNKMLELVLRNVFIPEGTSQGIQIEKFDYASNDRRDERPGWKIDGYVLDAQKGVDFLKLSDLFSAETTLVEKWMEKEDKLFLELTVEYEKPESIVFIFRRPHSRESDYDSIKVFTDRKILKALLDFLYEKP